MTAPRPTGASASLTRLYEVTPPAGPAIQVHAERVLVEAGALIFYGPGDGSTRLAILDAFGIGAWLRCRMLREDGN